MTLETDYLVAGAGLAGLAFADAILEGSDASLVIVDRNYAPGGHWVHAYPFVRLHQPSRIYGVASMPLGGEQIVPHGIDEGLYERASGAEIAGYFDRVMQQRLLSSGRVRYLPRHELMPDGRVRSLMSGAIVDVKVRKRLVDATYLTSEVPAMTPPRYEVADGVDCVPPGEVARRDLPRGRYVIVGAGKTAMDTCQFLVQQGVDPERIRWIRPRDPWMLNRDHYQGGDFVLGVLQGQVLAMEVAADAKDVDDYFARCGELGVYLRIDPDVQPTMMRGPTSHERELEQIRQVRDVVRMGHVERIERDRLVLDRGELPASADDLYVHCASDGVPGKPSRLIWEADRITIQHVRQGNPSFSYSLIGHLEASERSDEEKNRLAPPNAFGYTPLDWIRMTIQSYACAQAWGSDPALSAWIEGTRLNVLQGVVKLATDPEGGKWLGRFGAALGPGLQGMQRLLASATPSERARFWPPA